MVLCSAPRAWGAADYYPPTKSKSKDPVAKAREALRAAQASFAAAKARVATAKAHLRQLSHDAPLKWKEVEKLHDSESQLVAARESYDRSRKALEEAKRPLLDKLRSQPEYHRAVTERDALQAKLKGLPLDSSYERKDTEHQFALAQKRVRDLEKQALESDSEGKTLLASAGQDESSLQEMIRQKEADMQNDPTLAGIRDSIARAKVDVAAAEQNLAVEARNLAAAEKRLADEEAKHRPKPKAKKKRR